MGSCCCGGSSGTEGGGGLTLLLVKRGVRCLGSPRVGGAEIFRSEREKCEAEVSDSHSASLAMLGSGVTLIVVSGCKYKKGLRSGYTSSVSQK